jgi:hypothetical protein
MLAYTITGRVAITPLQQTGINNASLILTNIVRIVKKSGADVILPARRKGCWPKGVWLIVATTTSGAIRSKSVVQPVFLRLEPERIESVWRAMNSPGILAEPSLPRPKVHFVPGDLQNKRKINTWKGFSHLHQSYYTQSSPDPLDYCPGLCDL